ncbi:PDI-like 5-1 [Striga asiatica]|uniref:PDI-like 5-1 n=1 Tax=Striga asiatica TaxID=4170 RepID=A0A5A7PZV3_STRAF|nr:PDI-like 5-1 [Striga asiatica]
MVGSLATCGCSRNCIDLHSLLPELLLGIGKLLSKAVDVRCVVLSFPFVIQEISLACRKRQSGVRVDQEQVHAPSLFILCSAYIGPPIIGILHDTASRMELRLVGHESGHRCCSITTLCGQ